MPNTRMIKRSTIGAVLTVALFTPACTPLSIPGQSSGAPTLIPAEVVPTSGLVATEAYPEPDSSLVTPPSPEPTGTDLPSETPFPTRVVELGGQNVTLPDGSLDISVPEGWFAYSLPHEMDIQNYPYEDAGGEFMAGDSRVRIVLNVSLGEQGQNTRSLIDAVVKSERDYYAANGLDASGLLDPEAVTLGELAGHQFHITDAPGYLVVYLADGMGHVVRIAVLPTSSPTFDEALKIVESIRFN